MPHFILLPKQSVFPPSQTHSLSLIWLHLTDSTAEVLGDSHHHNNKEASLNVVTSVNWYIRTLFEKERCPFCGGPKWAPSKPSDNPGVWNNFPSLVTAAMMERTAVKLLHRNASQIILHVFWFACRVYAHSGHFHFHQVVPVARCDSFWRSDHVMWPFVSGGGGGGDGALPCSPVELVPLK